MNFQIERDYFDNPTQPQIFLCQTNKDIIGEVRATDVTLNAKWNGYSTLSFHINRCYVDTFTGEKLVDPMFDMLECPRIIKVGTQYGYYQIQDDDTSYSNNDEKTITAFSLEYATSTKFLRNFYINTGEVDSQEVIYWARIKGDDYWLEDTYYQKAGTRFDPYKRYYIKDYEDARSYTYVEVQIKDEEEFNTYDGSTVAKTLYEKAYPNVQLYNPNNPELSLLHLVVRNIPEWTIGHVDRELQRQERMLSADKTSVYDFMMNDVSSAFKCMIEWDNINCIINVYEESDDGLLEDQTIKDKFETDVFISKDNLASQINLKISGDHIKTKLHVTGGNGLDIRDINLGQDFILNLDYYHTPQWMGHDLYSRYSDYLQLLEAVRPRYSEWMKKWVQSYNKWNDLMNAVPVGNNVLLIGDVFTKLYCTYSNNYTLEEIAKNNRIMKQMSDSYNAAVGYGVYGNMDYNKRPVIMGDKMREYYPEFDGEAATTYDMGYEFELDGIKHIVLMTPIHEDGTIFSQVALDEYYDSLDKAHLLQSDYLKLVEHTEVQGQSTFWDGNNFLYEEFNDMLIPYKEAHLDSYFKIEDLKEHIDTNAIDALKKWLMIYHVDQDTKANKTDNVLLTLKNSNDDSAVIRVFFDGEFKVRRTLRNAITGIYSDKDYSIERWSDLELTDQVLGLVDFKIASIGTLGAYLCLVKDERQPENIADYGIKLLEEKQKTYMLIFQTQTEAMLASESFKCIASSNVPTGEIPEGTRWLDTDSATTKLYIKDSTYTSGEYTGWKPYDIAVDRPHYEDYARYAENYDKLKTVQDMLVRKQKIADYYLNGIKIEGVKLDEDHRTVTNFRDVAQQYFGIAPTNTRVNEDDNVFYCTITKDGEAIDYAIYMAGDIPYAAYASSQGVAITEMNNIKNDTDMNTYFTEEEWTRLNAFIREDDFSDSNFELNGYESEEERLHICEELMKQATKELRTLSQPSIEFSLTMGNILAIKEFTPIMNQFKLGNFIRIGLPNDMIKRARLLEYTIDFTNLDSLSCTFGNLITAQSEINTMADLLSQAVQAGKTVASSAATWQRGTETANEISDAINDGLSGATLNVGKETGQTIEIGQYGIWGRKLVEGTTDTYEPEQFRIINNKLVFSADGFETSKAVFGKYQLNGEDRWGVLAECLSGGLISGSRIEGGSLKIGTGSTYFQVSEDGSVAIMADGKEAYAGAEIVAEIEKSRQYHIELSYTNSTVFNEPNQSCTITAKLYKWDEDVTSRLPIGTKYMWIRNSSSDDTAWNAAHIFMDNNKITITNDDVNMNAQFSCQIDFDDDIL